MTRDHVPSKVLLDEPYPANLPVVDACSECNNGFSKAEPYLACLVDCALHGFVPPPQGGREKVRRILDEKPSLAREIEGARRLNPDGMVLWEPDPTQVIPIVMKLARGHAAYEFAEPQLDEPKHLSISPLHTLSEDQRGEFEAEDRNAIQGWPEIGSRAFCQMLVVGNEVFDDDGWTVVQASRYRYRAMGGPIIRIVLSEYLACEIAW